MQPTRSGSVRFPAGPRAGMRRVARPRFKTRVHERPTPFVMTRYQGKQVVRDSVALLSIVTIVAVAGFILRAYAAEAQTAASGTAGSAASEQPSSPEPAAQLPAKPTNPSTSPDRATGTDAKTPGISSNDCVLSSTAGGAGLSGPPMRAPSGSVPISPGGIQAAVNAHGPGTSFRLQPGVYKDGTVWVKGGDAFYGEGQVQWDGGGQATAFNIDGANVIVSGITFTGFSSADNGGTGLFNSHSTGLLIEGNTIADNRGTPIQIDADGWKVQNNCIHDNGSIGVASYRSSNVIVSHNEVYNNSKSTVVQKLPARLRYASGIKFFETHDATIEGNYIHNNDGIGIWFDTKNTGTVIKGNQIANNQGAGIVEEISYSSTITNNTMIANKPGYGLPGYGLFINTSSYVTAFGNYIINNPGGGICIFQSFRGSGPKGVYAARDNDIHDNYVSMSEGHMAVAGGAQLDASNKFMRNHYCLSGSAAFSVGGYNTSRAGWQAAGYDTAGTFSCGF